MSFSDKTLTCRECGTEFVFTAGEQEFYASRGLANEPGRCPSCRAARKSRGGGQMRGQDYGGYGYSREPRQMYPAVCAQCGAETQVPFAPRGDRPVYCSTCYDRVRSYR